MSKLEQAVRKAEQIAADNAHGYGWGGWGPDYDCGHLIIDSFEREGIPVRSKGGASYTGDMRRAWLRCGAQDVKASVNLNTGAGLKRGDVLVNEANHAALFVGGGRIVQARTDLDGRPGDSSGQEIRVQSYYNYTPGGWDCVMRFPEEPAEDKDVPTTEPQPEQETKPETPEAQVVPIGVKLGETFRLELHVLRYGAGMGKLKALKEEVRALQRQLKGLGFDLGPCGLDGEFGNDTRRAVEAYQRSVSLKADGEAGQMTRASLEGVSA